MFAARGVNLYLPQTAKVALFLFAVVKSMRPGMQQGFFRRSVFGFSTPAETFSIPQHIFSSLMGDGASFDSSHCGVDSCQFIVASL